jgi:putative membrane protein
MAGLMWRWIGNSCAILVAAALFDRVSVASVPDAFIAGAVLGIINSVVKPILVILTLPVTILTLGVFYFLWMTSTLLDGFSVSGVMTTLVAAMLVSVISAVITSALRPSSESTRS